MKITKLLAGGVVLLALFSCSTSVEETVEKQETPEIAEIPEVPKTYTISIAESLNGSVAASYLLFSGGLAGAETKQTAQVKLRRLWSIST